MGLFFIKLTLRHPGIFCLFGKIIETIVETKKISKFTIDDWNLVYSEGKMIKSFEHFPITQKIITNFKEGNRNIDPEFIKKSKEIFNMLISQNIEEFKLEMNEITTFLADEGLIIDIDNSKFKITSPVFRDIFGILLLKKSNISNIFVHQNSFNFIKVLIESFKCFDKEKLKLNIENQKTYQGLNELVYQFELGAILTSILPYDISVIVHAKIKENENLKYPDLLIACEKFKINIELLANKESSKISSHIERTKVYGDKFKADPWIIHFIVVQSMKELKDIPFPDSSDVNVIYLFHDYKFSSMKMKYKKKGYEKSEIISLY